jgi:putative transcriptional regulator
MQGQFLVASPQLADTNFYRSVVLVASHDDEHAFGLVLNRQGHHTIAAFWEQLIGTALACDQPVRYGGPLEGPLIVIHTDPAKADAEIIPGVHLSSQREHVVSIVESNRQPMMIVNGYSGWGPGQLDRELETGGWLTMKATPEIVFADPDLQWKLATKRISDDILAGIDVRHVPPDPRWN